MNKNIIIASVLFLLIGFGVGYLYFKNSPVLNNVVENQEVKTETQEQVKAEQNKLFAFLDSKKGFYTDPVSKDGGEIRITKLDHNLGLMVVDYPTSQESSNYAVYDYKNNIFYDEVGNAGLDEISNMPNATPAIFINEDQVLMEAGINFDESNNSEYPLSVRNFRTGALVKNLPIKFDMKSPTYNQVNFGLENAGKVLYIYVYQRRNDQQVVSSSTYVLNPETLEVKKTN